MRMIFSSTTVALVRHCVFCILCSTRNQLKNRSHTSCNSRIISKRHIIPDGKKDCPILQLGLIRAKRGYNRWWSVCSLSPLKQQGRAGVYNYNPFVAIGSWFNYAEAVVASAATLEITERSSCCYCCCVRHNWLITVRLLLLFTGNKLSPLSLSLYLWAKAPLSVDAINASLAWKRGCCCRLSFFSRLRGLSLVQWRGWRALNDVYSICLIMPVLYFINYVGFDIGVMLIFLSTSIKIVMK